MNSKLVQQLTDQIQKGEKVKVLFEILMAEVGMTYDNSNKEIMYEVAKIVSTYYEATDKMAEIIKETLVKDTSEEKLVSVSNY